MKTSKAVGETFSFAVNAGLTLTLSWADNSSDEIITTGLLQEITLKSQSLTISCEKSITSLYVADNDLTELNVSNIASTLTNLCCANNRLTTLSLTGCTNLVSLDCQGNQLTSLSVPSSKMENLNVADNKLTSPGLSSGTTLKSVVLANNNLTSANLVTNTTKLTSLFCQGNKITSLSVYNNANLRHLLAYDNSIKTLNFVSNSKKAALIEDLWVSDNQLTSLNVTELKGLVGLVAGNNKLETVTWNSSTARNTVKYVDISNNMLNFNSFPSIYMPLTDSYTLDGIVAPQNPSRMLDDIAVDQPTDDDFKKLIESNGWNTKTSATLKLTDQDGKELEQNVDYTYSNIQLKFLTQPHNGVVLTVTSRNYPGVEIKSLPFNVVAGSDGIETLELDAQEGDVRIYDLQGRRMNASSLKKGIYVVNGRKVIVR